jgi:hypothetical protein
MNFQANLHNAFENVAPHITNLDAISSLIQQLSKEGSSLRASMILLEEKKNNVDITLRTDIQILINEINHILRVEKRKSIT